MDRPHGAAALLISFAVLGAFGAAALRDVDQAPAEPSEHARTVWRALAARPLEARLGKGLPHIPFVPRRPAGSARVVRVRDRPRADSARPRSATHAVAEILDAAARRPSAETLSAVGLIYVVDGEPDRAVEAFRDAAAASGAGPAALGDLAAAHLFRARERDDPAALVEALEAAEAALAREPALHEALFNRALALEGLFLADAAKRAWAEYLAADAVSPWADEARAHAGALEARVDAGPPADLRARLEVVASGNRDHVRALVERHPQACAALALDELLPEWAEAARAGEVSRADRLRELCHAVSLAHYDVTGDAFVVDAVDAIGRGPREALVEGHLVLRDARRAFRANDVETAGAMFRRAEVAFARSGSVPSEAAAADQAAVCDLYGGRFAGALEEFERVAEMAGRLGYVRLRALATWHQATSHLKLGQYSAALARYREALESMRAAGDLESVARLESLVAETLGLLGDLAGAFLSGYRALESLSRARPPEFTRIAILTDLAMAVARDRRFTTALHFLTEAIGRCEASGDARFLPVLHFYRSGVAREMGDEAGAREGLGAARRHLESSPSPYFAASLRSHLNVVDGALHVAGDPAAAVERLSESLSFLGVSEERFLLVEALLFRARANLALGHEDRAEADLDRAIRECERRRERVVDPLLRSSYFEGPQAVYDEMIALQARRADMKRALYYAEAARARALLDAVAAPDGASRAAALTADEIRQGLPDGVTLVEFAVLPDRLLVWVIRRAGVEASQREIGRAELAAEVAALRGWLEGAREGAQAASRLYDTLARRAIEASSGEETLVFVPSRELHAVPFAALVKAETGAYLVEERASLVAPSASVFVRCSDRKRRLSLRGGAESVLAVGDPTSANAAGDDLGRLERSEREAKEVGALYGGSDVMIGPEATAAAFLERAPRHEVVHFAGHALADPAAAGRSRLVFARGGSDGASGALFADEISRLRFARTRLVVLAACRTAGGRVLEGEGVASLASAFLTTGVPTVVASSWDVDDRETHRLLVHFHRARLACGDEARALREAQLRRIRPPSSARGAMNWAAFQVHGGVAGPAVNY